MYGYYLFYHFCYLFIKLSHLSWNVKTAYAHKNMGANSIKRIIFSSWCIYQLCVTDQALNPCDLYISYAFWTLNEGSFNCSHVPLAGSIVLTWNSPHEGASTPLIGFVSPTAVGRQEDSSDITFIINSVFQSYISTMCLYCSQSPRDGATWFFSGKINTASKAVEVESFSLKSSLALNRLNEERKIIIKIMIVIKYFMVFPNAGFSVGLSVYSRRFYKVSSLIISYMKGMQTTYSHVVVVYIIYTLYQVNRYIDWISIV